MKKYFVKAPISGWHEVSKEQFEKFCEHLREHATPCGMTIDELVECRTKIAE